MYVTRGLSEALLELAAAREPEAFEADLGITPAAEFAADLEYPPETPIFTHFYLPEAGASVSAVFGVELGRSPAITQGRFISHPAGQLEVLPTDELRAHLLVAIPPWDHSSLAAFDRAGRRHELILVDAEPPEPRL